MKIIKVFFLGIALIIASIGFAGITTAQESKQDNETAKVNVYYFHFNARCVTCRAVESEAKMNVEELFGDDVKFTAVNLDEKAGEEKGKKLGVNSQSLVVFKGDKKIELTTEGFMYARTDPKKFREIMKEKIQPLL